MTSLVMWNVGSMKILSSPYIQAEPKNYKMPDFWWMSEDFKKGYKEYLINLFGSTYPAYVINTDAMLMGFDFEPGPNMCIVHPSAMVSLKLPIGGS